MFLVSIFISIFSLGDVFFYDLIENMVYAINLGFFSLIHAYILEIWSSSNVSCFLCVPFLVFLFHFEGQGLAVTQAGFELAL